MKLNLVITVEDIGVFTYIEEMLSEIKGTVADYQSYRDASMEVLTS